MKFHEYFLSWIETFKKGTVKKVTYEKYTMTYQHLKRIAPDVELSELNRANYQNIINEFGKDHAKTTVGDFHTHLKACLYEAFDERLIDRNPARRVVINGQPNPVRNKFLEIEEIKKLMDVLDIDSKTIKWDHMFFLMMNTGARFAEVLALTPKDFDFEKMTIDIHKSYNYKEKELENRFMETKNRSSIRIIDIDLKVAWIFKPLIENIPEDEPIFPYGIYGTHHPVIFNATPNSVLKTRCKKAGIPEISVHGLRHTHASLLIANNIDMQVVAKRLGHVDTTVTQKVYVHLMAKAEKEANNQIKAIMVNL